MINNIKIKFKLITCSFLLPFVFLGCAGSGPLLRPDQGSRFAYISKHPELSVDIQQAIQDGKVIKGMTKEDVRAVWGDPKIIDSYDKEKPLSSYNQEGVDWWSYRGSSLSFSTKRYVKFYQGKVIDIKFSYWYDT